MEFDLKKVVFVVLFGALVLIGNSINFSPLLGTTNQFFTLFQFFGPVAGGFLGGPAGAAAVILAQAVDFIVKGKGLDLINILRLTPMIFAAWYFATQKTNWKDVSSFIPALAIFAFLVHPAGGQVWYFTLFWTIPWIVKLLPDRLVFRSLGATMTAHAVGGAFWIWTVPAANSVAYWNALIPVVAYERALFALGIAASYVVLNTVLSKLPNEWRVPHLNVDQRYVVA